MIVSIDYGMDLMKMIEQVGFSHFGPHITPRNFEVKGEGEVEVDLEVVHFDRKVTTEEVLTHFREHGLLPAKIEHLLAFAAANPDRDSYPIVALGSIWKHYSGGKGITYLIGKPGSRALCVTWTDDPFLKHFRFLAVGPEKR